MVKRYRDGIITFLNKIWNYWKTRFRIIYAGIRSLRGIGDYSNSQFVRNNVGTHLRITVNEFTDETNHKWLPIKIR